MAKLKNPLLSLQASGSVSRALTFLRRNKVNLVEKKPEIKDIQSGPQLAWRHMFNKCVDLWHALSPAEKQEWESAARSRHMTGYAWYISQCLRPNPGIYLPLQGGTMSGDIDMEGHRVLDLPDPYYLYEAARKAYVDASSTPGREGARVYHSADQSIPDTTVTTLAFNSERYDTDDCHDIVTNNSRLTAKTPGIYLISLTVRWEVQAGGVRSSYIRYYGADYIAKQDVSTAGITSPSCTVAALWYMPINSFVEARVFQSSGVAVNVRVTPKYAPEFMMQRVG